MPVTKHSRSKLFEAVRSLQPLTEHQLEGARIRAEGAEARRRLTADFFRRMQEDEPERPFKFIR
jgi:hypothetical protein